MNIEKSCNHYRTIVDFMLSEASQDRPMIVGWSIARRGQVIEGNLGQLSNKLATGPRVLATAEPLRTQSGTRQGGTTARSLDEVGTTSVRPNTASLYSDCTFLDKFIAPPSRKIRPAIERSGSGGQRPANSQAGRWLQQSFLVRAQQDPSGQCAPTYGARHSAAFHGSRVSGG